MTNKPVCLHTQRVVLYNYFCSRSRCCSSGCPHDVGQTHVVPRTVLAMLVKLMLFSGLPQTVPLFLSVLGCCVHTSLQMLSTFYGVAAYCIIGGLQQLDIQMFFELPSWWFLCRRVPHQSTVPWSVGGLPLCALLTADVVSTLYSALAYRIIGGSQRHLKDCVLEVGFPCIYCPTNCLKH